MHEEMLGLLKKNNQEDDEESIQEDIEDAYR